MTPRGDDNIYQWMVLRFKASIILQSKLVIINCSVLSVSSQLTEINYWQGYEGLLHVTNDVRETFQL